jgi:DNA-binding transcriptional regulator YhcF (GntR family)
MLIAIDETNPRPIYEQIVAQIKQQVGEGALSPGAVLPSVRELAESLGVNLHTVHKAYQRLREEDVIELRLGRRARVAPARRHVSRREVEAKVLGKLHEAVTEARVLGLSAEDFRELVQESWTTNGGVP